MTMMAFVLLGLCNVSMAATSATDAAKPVAAATQTAQQTEVININTADAATLQQLKGIGAKKAQAILTYRKQQPFHSIDDLTKISGISEGLLNKIRANITVG